MRKLNPNSDSRAPSLKQLFNQCLGQVLGIQVQFGKYAPASKANKYAIRDQFETSRQKDLIELEYGVFDPVNGEFFLSHDTGLFSCLSVTLWSLSDLLDAGHIPRKINFQNSLSAYQDEPHTDDPFLMLFRPPANQNAHGIITAGEHTRRIGRFGHHLPYAALDYAALAPLLANFFSPTQQIVDRQENFRSRYLVAGQRYIGVCIRGTDKGTEVPHTDSSLYIERADALLSQGLADRVFIQTDQVQIYDIFKHRFEGICDAVEDLPRTSGMVVMHKTAAVHGQRIIFAQDMIAAVSMIANMPHVITHTGNIGAWISLMRGNATNVWQATAAGIVNQSLDGSR